jgi:hypothetical protein
MVPCIFFILDYDPEQNKRKEKQKYDNRHDTSRGICISISELLPNIQQFLFESGIYLKMIQPLGHSGNQKNWKCFTGR